MATEPTPPALEHGRSSFANRSWTDAHASLARADAEEGLSAEDLELLSTSAYMLGRVDEMIGGLERALDVTNVIWCTGFSPGFSWIDLPVFDDSGIPIHERGVVPDQPGLYFVGLNFLHSLWSETITGVQPDARHVVNHLARRTRPKRALEPAFVREG